MNRARLSDIVEGLQFQSDEMAAFLHRPTGRVLLVSDDAVRAAEDDREDSVEPEELADARGILTNSGDYVSLPDRFEIDEYSMMETFAASLVDVAERDNALASLHGSGAFRRFKNLVNRLGLSEKMVCPS